MTGSLALRAAALAAVVGVASVLAGCGCDSCDDGPYYPPPVVLTGSVDVDNLTDLGPAPESALGFYLALAGTGLFTGNLLPAPLLPGFVAYVGDFDEDYYDAEADMELGDLITWFDVPVPAGDVTTFEIY